MSEVLSVRVVAKRLGGGGATRASLRILEALERHGDAFGLNAVALTLQSTEHRASHDELPHDVGSRLHRHVSRAARRVRDRLPWETSNPVPHARADLWTGLGGVLQRSNADVINLQWIGDKTLSIEELGRITKPIVWTMHDMWGFCGSEHHTSDGRHRTGYARTSRPIGVRGVDWERHTWRRKQRAWRRPMTIVAPSRWMADCVQRSALMQDWPVTVIPNPIDPSIWRPMHQPAARDVVGLPVHAKVVLFGAEGGETQSIKGGDLLAEALARLPRHLGVDASGEPVIAAVFGGSKRWTEPVGRLPYPVHHLGRINDDRLLRAVYAAADVMVVPSRMDNLPNVAIESSMCGSPVVAFRVGGLPDIVEDRVTGRLVEAFEVDAMARAIADVLTGADGVGLGERAARSAAERFAPQRIAARYADTFRAARDVGRS